MSYSVAKLRRAYFACVKALGMSEDDRHAFNDSRVGKASTREFEREDWKGTVAELQRLTGLPGVPEGKPRLKSERPERRAAPGGWATWKQAELIEGLADRIAWRAGRERGPLEYVCGHFLPGEENAFRRELLRRHGGTGRWTKLTRAEAQGIIAALKKMCNYYPVVAGKGEDHG